MFQRFQKFQSLNPSIERSASHASIYRRHFPVRTRKELKRLEPLERLERLEP